MSYGTSNAELILIPLFPLLGALLAYLLGLKNRDFSGPVATLASLLSFVWVVRFFFELPSGESFFYSPFVWFASGNLNVEFLLTYDQLSAVMCLVITGIGTLIHLYSVGYMAHDESRHRFFCYLNLFMFSMLLLVLGGNLLVLFVGWEGVGLCSYLLIGFWYKNLSYAAAGRKAFVVNRIGDAGFLLAIFLLFANFGTVEFKELAVSVVDYNNPVLYGLVALCLFIGATGKSAQIPLFVWLPDAMAGPTPVSALIHAATMVTAGIYMMARMSFLFELAPLVMAIICWVAIATALMAASIALTQNDIKKVLAYSTVSQLGFMFMAASVGAYWVAIFHVVTHAFFKACLFLGAGSVIHGCHHEQDMRQMGGLLKLMPVTAITYAISTISIAGIYPLAGYQSKHAILHVLGDTTNPYLAQYSGLLVLLASAVAFMTAFYMARSFALTFLGKYRGHAHPHESPWIMTIPLIVLAFLAVVGGLAIETTLPQHLSAIMPIIGEQQRVTIVEGILLSWVGIFGVVLGLVLYTRLYDLPGRIYAFFGLFSKLLYEKYYIDQLYNRLIVQPLEKLSGFLYKAVDQGTIDATVNGAAAMAQINGEILKVSQSGQLKQYALYILIGAVLLLVFGFMF